jgi:hypothetical protein
VGSVLSLALFEHLGSAFHFSATSYSIVGYGVSLSLSTTGGTAPAIVAIGAIVAVAVASVLLAVRFANESVEPKFGERPFDIGGGGPSEPHLVGEVDSLLQRMHAGIIAYNAPAKMILGDKATIQLALALNVPPEKLKALITAPGDKISANSKASERMEAHLSGRNFSIDSVTPEIQAVALSDITSWQWQVTPTASGRQTLHLIVSAVLTVERQSTPRALDTFDRSIEVEVGWTRRTAAFFGNNWQWLWTAILVPIVGWLWSKRRARPKRIAFRWTERA